MNRFKFLSLNPFTSIAILLLLANSIYVMLAIRYEHRSPNQRIERTEILVKLPEPDNQLARMPIPMREAPVRFSAPHFNAFTKKGAQQL